MKRSQTPAFWPIPRKMKRFAPRVSPGPHRASQSLPIVVFLRDLLKLVSVQREAESILAEGAIIVDGKKRSDPTLPLGLMDTIEIPSISKTYRLLPQRGGTLRPVEIPDTEKNLKLCKVTSKSTVKSGKIQIGTSGGRSLLLEKEVELNRGDSCLIELPSQKLVKTVRFDKGALALVVGGARQGSLGRIKDIKSGTMTRSQTVLLKVEGSEWEVPSEYLMVVGKETPLITLGQ